MPAHILIIEDNRANLELMSYLLGAFGYDPHTAGDGATGVEIARERPFDLIVCDIHMPGVDGYEVARRLKADPVLRAVPLVAVTALAMVGDRDRVLAAGFDGYIAKPIDPETFVVRVEEYLRHEHRTAAAHARAAPAAANKPTNGLTILVVDNLSVNRDLACSILEPHGYRVLTADGVDQGLAVARGHACDLILSDVCMTGESGYDFIRAVKADGRLAAIPFVFITSTMLEENDRVTGLCLGAARFLCRPIEPDALLAELEACLRAAGRLALGDDSDR
ncbi:response regulator [Frigoriglobus tundricola]|uniref:Phosphate regulon transcriptional regulatory protein PhoB (SphR) n=1 Tax=Frigoriglobus tundricola TaxID=2774151 RepID=A0A6M5YL21_9BACT|nr:response regulator [Frigoriglobus tundricola]QJW93702.1 Phosphate regulon transcriptional regulatory protein PhoB (SphR) [Frigoriglobus tundricola]